MTWLRNLAFTLAVALIPGAALAQTATPNARAIALVERMMTVSGVEQQVDNMIATLGPAMANGPAYAQLNTAQRKLVQDTVREVMRDTFTPELVKRMTPVYAATFTEEELAAIVAFYESAAGQAAIKKTPLMVQSSVAIAQSLIPGAQAEIERRVCEKVGCKSARPKRS